ncbi:hypothetical protein ACFXDE_21075 [Kitasatospora sp. NPDC059408]|uniref:hypothetical protein n=1 Tax=Kitasatospora sp. NPDC059408 TaxID=3346823 RepID=UPI00367F4B66
MIKKAMVALAVAAATTAGVLAAGIPASAEIATGSSQDSTTSVGTSHDTIHQENVSVTYTNVW